MSVQVEKKKCGIYFISDGKFLKIGQAEDIEKRQAGLQTGNPNPLILVAYIECLKKFLNTLEKKAHISFQKYHYNNEWFDLINDLDTIKEYVEKECGAILKEENRSLNNWKIQTLEGEASGRGFMKPCGIFPDQVAHSKYAYDDPRNHSEKVRSGRTIRFKKSKPGDLSYAGRSKDGMPRMYIGGRAHDILRCYLASLTVKTLETWLKKAKKRDHGSVLPL